MTPGKSSKNIVENDEGACRKIRRNGRTPDLQKTLWKSGVSSKSEIIQGFLDLGMSRGQALAFLYITTAVVALGAVPLRTVNRAGALALLAQTVLIFWILYRIERTASRKDSMN